MREKSKGGMLTMSAAAAAVAAVATLSTFMHDEMLGNQYLSFWTFVLFWWSVNNGCWSKQETAPEPHGFTKDTEPSQQISKKQDGWRLNTQVSRMLLLLLIYCFACVYLAWPWLCWSASCANVINRRHLLLLLCISETCAWSSPFCVGHLLTWYISAVAGRN